MTWSASRSRPYSLVTFHAVSILAGGLALAVLAGCGSGSAAPGPSPAAGTTVQVNMGDAPADWLLAFSMNVSSMSLKDSAGTSVGVTSAAPMPVEMIHRLGTMEPVAIASVPQGTYGSAHLTVTSCNFTYIDPVTKKPVEKTINGPIDVNIPFSPGVSVGATPVALNFDLDLEHSLTNPSGAFQLTPQFHLMAGALNSANGSGDRVDARFGGVYQMMGIVSSTSTSSFSVTPLQAANSFTFRTTTETRFQGKISKMSQVATGMGVLVTATIQSDGTLLATRVRAMMGAVGAMGGGIVTSVIGQPATELTIVMQNGAGASVNTDYLSKTITVALTDKTTYEMDTDRVSLDGLPFAPSFDASHIFAGQSVLPFSDDALVPNPSCDPACGTITASTLRLREQGFRGTAPVAINPGTVTSFILTIPADCAFTALTGATEITVYQQSGTHVEDDAAIAAGSTLRVHGLLLNTGGEWALVASTIASAS